MSRDRAESILRLQIRRMRLKSWNFFSVQKREKSTYGLHRLNFSGQRRMFADWAETREARLELTRSVRFSSRKSSASTSLRAIRLKRFRERVKKWSEKLVFDQILTVSRLRKSRRESELCVCGIQKSPLPSYFLAESKAISFLGFSTQFSSRRRKIPGF